MKNAIRWMSDDEFREAVRAAPAATKADADICVRKSFACEVRAEESKPVQMIISTGKVDRYDSKIALDGWELDNFKANPVVLFMHDRWSLPVARCTKIWVEGDALKAELQFAGADVNEDAPRVEAALRQGFLNAASVGFRPIEYGPRKDSEGRGIEYTKQELLEFSIVVIPGNAGAVATQRGLEMRAEVPSSTADRLAKVGDALDALAKAMGEHNAKHGECNKALDDNCKRLGEIAKSMMPDAGEEPEEPECEESKKSAPAAQVSEPTTPAPEPTPVAAAQMAAPVPTVDAERLTKEIAAAIQANGNDLAGLIDQ